MALFAASFDFVECLHFTLCHSVIKSLKSCQSWKISKQSVTRVRMQKSGARLANQIQGFRMPDRREFEAGEKINKFS